VAVQASRLTVAAVLLFSGSGIAQQTPPASPRPGILTPPPRVLRQEKDPDMERQNLLNRRAQLRREHSDASGTLRPDLQAKGLAQMRRMKVVHQIGAAPQTPPASQP
jgi:hypothetical protein